MVELRCNICPYLANNFCVKLKTVLPNGLAKLYYGGAIGVYYGSTTYPSKCGIKEEEKSKQKLSLIISSINEETLGQRQQL